jgi:putative membrane protein
MATRIPAKISLFSATALLAAATALAQSPQGPPGGAQQPSMPNQPSNPGMNTPGTTPGTAATSQQFGDQAFVAKAIGGGDAEVELAELAQQKSQSQDVKQFAQKMASDHSQMNEKWFEPEAKQLGVSTPKGPDKKDKKLIARLQTLSGQQFDNEYIQAMVKDHKQDLKDFNNEAQATQDPNVKQIAQRGATIIQEHLQMIEQIAKNHNVPVEGKGAKQTSSM